MAVMGNVLMVIWSWRTYEGSLSSLQDHSAVAANINANMYVYAFIVVVLLVSVAVFGDGLVHQVYFDSNHCRKLYDVENVGDVHFVVSEVTV